MYFVVESPQNLTVPINDMANVKSLKANRDNMFICSITGNYIMIWFTTTSMLIAFHQRADDSISIHGENHLVEWNNDSSKIAVMTTKGYLIYYKITFENEFVISDLSYAQSAWNDTLFSNKVQYKNPLLACRITHDFSIHIQHAQKNISCFNEEIFISLLNGKLIKVPWNDQARHDHFYLSLQKIYFKTETDGELFKLKENVYITEFELSVDYCFNCLAAVLSDSTAVYIISDSTNSFRGLVAKANNRNLSYRCVAINPLYKIVAFGCKNGIAVAFNQPDDYTQLQVSNYYVQSTKENDNSNVTHMRWSPDYNALAILYDNGTFSVFSVFGCLLYDSRELFSESGDVYNFVRTMEFGIDGYSLWLFVQSLEQNINGNLYRLKMLKSSSLNNCSMSNIEHISLNGEREVYVCLNLSKQSAAAASQKMQLNDATRQQSPPPGIVYPTLKLGGNTMWQVLNVPLTYIASNFPIRMSSIDTEGKHLAVAGVRGFTHYSFATRKWKMFGNAEQEKDIRITGGLLWWREFICMCCHNLVDQRDEIRFYSKNTNLDNSYAKISKTTCGILQMNIFNNLLVLFGIDCRIQVLGLEGGKDTTSKIILNKLIEIQVDSYVFRNPYLVVAVSLCPLYIGNYEDSLKKTIESNSSTMKSILINVAGNLLMFQPDLDSLLSIPEDLNKTKPFSSLPPIIIASCVENYWVVANNTRTKLINHFMNLSLWINCGFNGIKVWLPLSGDDNEVKQSTRIILTFPLNFYPLGLLINDALLIGAASENTSFSHNSYYQIQKTTQLFMPFVLEGLIRKGLSVDAKKLALGYRYLPYFLHILELLIHKILEEEAHSSEQSNRILPKVIEFISQFPEHLKIISHCTRKSEVAVWPYLFSIVGTSQLLFEKCLSQKDLETAASYLVVLQNTENSKTCEKLANMLLKASLKNGDWNLVKEIMRFISSIDPADFDSGEVFEFQSYGGGIISNSAATTAGEQSSQSPPPSAHSLHNSSSSPMAFKLNKTPTSATTTTTTTTTPGSGNRSSISMTSPASKKTNETTTTANTTPKTVNMSTSSVASNSTLKQRLSLNEFELSRRSIELTVHEYAMDLLKAYRVRRLFEMFSQLGFLNVFKWLEQYQSVALIENFVQAVSSVHFEFNWPYPIMINEFKKTNSFITPICEVVSGVVAKKNSNGNVSLTLTENTTPKVATALKKETSDPNINPALKTSSTKRPQPPSNLPLIGSDFIYDSPPNQAKSIANGNGSSNNITSQEENEPTTPENEDPSSFDFDLVAQQLAATSGSLDSKNKLYYIVETFTSCRCYEWVFVLALVLQNFSVLSEIARKMRDGNLPPDVVKSLRKGLEQLDDWSQNECCGYREIIKKLVDVI